MDAEHIDADATPPDSWNALRNRVYQIAETMFAQGITAGCAGVQLEQLGCANTNMTGPRKRTYELLNVSVVKGKKPDELGLRFALMPAGKHIAGKINGTIPDELREFVDLFQTPGVTLEYGMRLSGALPDRIKVPADANPIVEYTIYPASLPSFEARIERIASAVEQLSEERHKKQHGSFAARFTGAKPGINGHHH